MNKIHELYNYLNDNSSFKLEKRDLKDTNAYKVFYNDKYIGYLDMDGSMTVEIIKDGKLVANPHFEFFNNNETARAYDKDSFIKLFEEIKKGGNL